jgi:hypothetical protein
VTLLVSSLQINLKDGLQEVPKDDSDLETLLLPRRPERHLHPRAIQKKATKTQFPTWPMGPPVSRSHCILPCSLSLLFPINKIFLTSAAGVCHCFQSQSGPKNLEHQKIPAHHLCIICWPTKGHFTWGQYRLCQTGEDCLGSGCDNLSL